MAGLAAVSGPDAPAAPDWEAWLRRWDEQQGGYVAGREERFAAMLEPLGVLLPECFVALDLACGPGSISRRLLARFPEARCVAVDFDPLLLALGQGALGTAGSRLRWVEADIRSDELPAALDEPAFDAVLSSTALHWLEPDTLVRLYQRLAALLRPGGVFVNADRLDFDAGAPMTRRLAEQLTEQNRADAFAAGGREDWDAWLAAIGAEPALAGAVARRTRLMQSLPRPRARPSLRFHRAALLDAGFAEAEVIWQRLDDRVLLAVR
jgi:SAM-dependent methyltransferase